MFDYQPPLVDPHFIHIDSDLLVVDKPAELLSVPGRRLEHQDCLITRVQKNYPEALIVHRLDMSTSGLMVLARNPDIHRQLNHLFEQRLVEKTYIAVVNGQLKQPEGRIDLPIIRDWPNRPRQKVDRERGKAARTDFRVLSYDPTTDSSRIELQPYTGRTHQLRLHMQALGHPILGDDLYAGGTAFNKADRLLLHASKLVFNHPTSSKVINFTLEAPF